VPEAILQRSDRAKKRSCKEAIDRLSAGDRFSVGDERLRDHRSRRYGTAALVRAVR
jgi:hypothetical protein